jgi:hypothetical protein
MFETDQAQQARNVVMRRRKRPQKPDAAARQQAEIEAGNLVPEPAKPAEETGPVSATEAAIMKAEGLDPENEFDRQLYRRRSAIQRGKTETQPSTGVEQKPEVTPQPVTPASKEITKPVEETGPVSGMEAGIMRAEGLDPGNEMDRKIYRRRREIERAQAAARGNTTGTELNQMSVQNNDLQRQGSAPSSQPIVFQNNTNASTQTTVTPPAQPRVQSSFSRYTDSRGAWQ